MRYKIVPGPISGDTYVPPSKSHTMRALFFALMARGTSKIHNYLASPDTMAMIHAIEQFGARVQIFADHLKVRGVGGKLCCPSDVIYAGNSGLVLRFMTGLAALLDKYVILTGDKSIRERRLIKPLLDTLSTQKIFAKSSRGNGYAPVIIKGPLKPAIMAINGEDSQPVSALLMATSFLQGSSEIYVMSPGEKPWIDVTLGWLKDLGIKVQHHEYRYYKVQGNAIYDAFNVSIEGDFSAASYPLAAAMITGQNLRVYGLHMDDKQADKHFIDIICKMGANIQTDSRKKCVEILPTKEFSGIEIDVNHCIDTVPLLAVLGCFAKTPTLIKGAKMARHKESDRIAAIAVELKKMGAELIVHDDGLTIYPSKLQAAQLVSHTDHRIALALIIASFGAKGTGVIDGVECIAKSYPSFFADFMRLGAKLA